MNIGVRAHDFNTRSAEELAEAIASKGLTSVQLALAKSFPDMNTGLGSLSPGLAHYIGGAFRKHNVQIAVLGCYVNIIHPNLDERRKGLERFKEHIRFARDFGCSIVGTETGNVNAEMAYTEKNFEEKPFLEVVQSVRELAEEAGKFGIIVGIEAGVNHPIYSAQTMKRMLDMVDSNNVQVIFDPFNLLTIENYQHQTELFEEAMELLGDRIVVFHAKDFVVEDDKLKQVPVGKGIMDYETLFRLLKEKKPYVNVLMEGTAEEDIDESILFLTR